jgi:5-methylcytosine-specific restriction protein A
LRTKAGFIFKVVAMPTKPPGPCRWPGCPELQEPGGHGYCARHEKEYRREDAARRGSSRQRGYTGKYERARAWILKRRPLCALCEAEGRLTPATMTHHVVPLSRGGTNRSDNLLPVCRECHDRLHGGRAQELLAKLERALTSETERVRFF